MWVYGVKYRETVMAALLSGLWHCCYLKFKTPATSHGLLDLL